MVPDLNVMMMLDLVCFPVETDEELNQCEQWNISRHLDSLLVLSKFSVLDLQDLFENLSRS